MPDSLDGEAAKGHQRLRRVAERVPLLRRLAVARVGAIEREISALRSDIAGLREGLGLLLDDLRDDVSRQSHNHELLKGELWDTRVLIDSARLPELRDRVAAVDRRLRRLERLGTPASGGEAAGQPGGTEPAAPVSHPTGAEVSSTLFDYVGFERRFRGDPDVINAVLLDRYGELLRQHQPVVDIGCGRGELLALLAHEGVEVIGVEPDPGMADEARARGVPVHQMLASEYLHSVPDNSLGSIIATHVVEHLPLDVLIDFLERSAEKLRPGGWFIAETPNPATLIVLGSHFIMDPTHEWPLHPDLLRFLCESAGFRDVRTEFFSPATTLQLPLGKGDEVVDPELAARVDEGFARLNQVLFGPQDYAVFATVGDTRIATTTEAVGAAPEPAEEGPAAEPAEARGSEARRSEGPAPRS